MQRTDLAQFSHQLQTQIDIYLAQNQNADVDIQIYTLINIFQEQLREYVISLSFEIDIDDHDFNEIVRGLNGVEYFYNTDFIQLSRDQRISFIQAARVLEYLRDIILMFENQFPDDRNITIPCTKIHYAQIALYSLFHYMEKQDFDDNTVKFFNIFFENIFPCFPANFEQRDLIVYNNKHVKSLYGSNWYEIFIYELCKDDRELTISTDNYSEFLEPCLTSGMSDIEKYIVINQIWKSFKAHEKMSQGENFLRIMISHAKQGNVAASYWIVLQTGNTRNDCLSLNFNGYTFNTRLTIIMNALAFPAIDTSHGHPALKAFNLMMYILVTNNFNIKHIESCVKALTIDIEDIRIYSSSLRKAFIIDLKRMTRDSRFDAFKLTEYIVQLQIAQATLSKIVMFDNNGNPLFQKLWNRDGSHQILAAEKISQSEISKNASLFGEICVDETADTYLHQLPTEIFVRIAIETRFSFFHSQQQAQAIVFENFNNESADSDNCEISKKSSNGK